ncbi:MAG: endo-1,4-beta-xylanase [Myxococcota bacterium]|jgi:endo-1,4-beta-xylanase
MLSACGTGTDPLPYDPGTARSPDQTPSSGWSDPPPTPQTDVGCVGSPAVASPPAGAEPGAPGTLRYAAAVHGKLVGAALSLEHLGNDATYAQLAADEFSSVTPENAMKWGFLQPAPGEWDFGAAEAVVAIAETSGQVVKGHALVWHRELPWFVEAGMSDGDLRSAVKAHIQKTVSHFAGRVHAWDVVNEAVWEDGSLRDTLFRKQLGPTYVADAFRWAHEADPKAKLYYNDYGILWGDNPKADGVYALLSGLVAQGVPVHGIGFQMHIMAPSYLPLSKIQQNFQRFEALGLTVNVSELDVRLGQADPSKLEQQAAVYAGIAALCLSVPACTGITTWGVTDKYSWVNIRYGGGDAPLLFDADYQKKPAYESMLETFEEGNTTLPKEPWERH